MTIIRPDIGLIYSLLTSKCFDLSLLIDYSTYFKDVIQYYCCQFSPVSALNNRGFTVVTKQQNSLASRNVLFILRAIPTSFSRAMFFFLCGESLSDGQKCQERATNKK